VEHNTCKKKIVSVESILGIW